MPKVRGTELERHLRCTLSTQRTIPAARSASYARSLVPATTRIWNELPNDLRVEHSQRLFKKSLFACTDINTAAPFYFSIGPKLGNELHTHIRLAASDLNEHRNKLGKNCSASCKCGAAKENTEHFLLICPLFHSARDKLFDRLTVVLGTNFRNIPHKKKTEMLINRPSQANNNTVEGVALAVQTRRLP